MPSRLCGRCHTAPPLDGKSRCQRCIDRDKELYQERKDRRLCIVCRKPLGIGAMVTCLGCRKIRRASQRRFERKQKLLMLEMDASVDVLVAEISKLIAARVREILRKSKE